MLSPRCQRGLEAKIFGLGLGLVLTKVVLVAPLSVIEFMSFTLRSSLIGNCCLLYSDTVVTAILGVISWY